MRAGGGGGLRAAGGEKWANEISRGARTGGTKKLWGGGRKLGRSRGKKVVSLAESGEGNEKEGGRKVRGWGQYGKEESGKFGGKDEGRLTQINN